MTLFEKIKALCDDKGISIRKLEVACGFGNGYIARLTDTMPTDRAVKIAEYFGLPADYFFSDATKKGSDHQNPLLEKLMVQASSLNEKEIEELLSFAGYIQSKHKDI